MDMGPQQVVLVTGSSSGFGLLTAQTLARKGCRVFASMRGTQGKNARARDEALALARDEGLALEVVEMDVADDSSVEGAVAHVVARAGRLDVAVNNAGVGSVGLTETFTPRQVRTLFETNVLGAHRVNRAVLPHMRRQGAGLLVHVTSVAGRVLVPFLGPYCATKFALEALAESYHHELAPLGIDCVIVEPGAFGTNVGTNALAPEDGRRADEYPGAGATLERVGQAFGAYLGRPDAPDPQQVADVIAGLVALPAGKRPLRTLVGPDAEKAESLNRTAELAQREVLIPLGLADAWQAPGRGTPPPVRP
jgi:NAD(P)-dependent dehydrogenase (short-subunit alcohol dehydrogenase family)